MSSSLIGRTIFNKIIIYFMAKRKWTDEEDKIVVQAVQAKPQNLKKCFLTVASEIDRTPEAVHTRWYNAIRYTQEGREAMLTISSKTAFCGKNELDNSKVKPIKIRRKSFWKTLLTTLGLK